MNWKNFWKGISQKIIIAKTNNHIENQLDIIVQKMEINPQQNATFYLL